jgi:nucleoid-associated protein YgaU
MQKDFKIGLAIGTVLAVGVIIWLATLPNLSAHARALRAASGLDRKNYQPTPGQAEGPALSTVEGKPFSSNPSPKIQLITPSPANSPAPSDSEIRDTNAQPTQRIHIIQKGDTLSSISAKYYGSANQWRKILAANRDNLPNPNRLTPGVKLIIPQ